MRLAPRVLSVLLAWCAAASGAPRARGPRARSREASTSAASTSSEIPTRKWTPGVVDRLGARLVRPLVHEQPATPATAGKARPLVVNPALRSFLRLPVVRSLFARTGLAWDRLPVRQYETLGQAIAAEAKAQPSSAKQVVFEGNRLVGGPYIGGARIGAKVRQFVEQSQHELFTDIFYIEEGSWLADTWKEALAKKDPSFKLYVMVNATKEGWRGKLPFGNEKFRRETAERLRSYLGWQNLEVLPIDDNEMGNRMLGTWKQHDWLGRDVMHSKFMTSDGERLLMLDTNFQKTSDPVQKGGQGWNQMAWEVEGPIARGARDMAAEWWLESEGVKVPELPAAKAPPPGRGETMILLGKKAGAREASSINAGMRALLTHADNEIRILTPNLNDEKNLAALAQATATANKVKIFLPYAFNEHAVRLPFQGGTNVVNVRRLRNMAIDPSKLDIRWFTYEEPARPARPTSPGARGLAERILPSFGNGRGASHAKQMSGTMRTGEGWHAFGSWNGDAQSALWSNETAVAAQSGTAAFNRAFDAMFERSPIAFKGDVEGAEIRVPVKK